MTAKEKVMNAVEALPDDAAIENAMERLLVPAKFENGIRQADAEQTIPYSIVKDRISKWL